MITRAHRSRLSDWWWTVDRAMLTLVLLLLLSGLALMVLVLFVGAEIKGSRRWLFIAGVSIQPSEFLKPAFIVITAWLFAEGSRRPDVPGRMLAIVLLIITTALLIAEPDLGQTILIVAVWCALFFLAGVSSLVLLVLGGIGVAGLFAAYT